MAADAVLCTDGAAQYGVVAKGAGIEHFVL
jgi:hypothetical protein